ncbi:NADH dehydrogenase [uncultured Synechococcales cyanobacterium]|uniref:NADH dehydrogenase n=1 Tax=uncultured Synechococcales cyanobacterium TaxID=1936017 RepID=A0A6J4VVW2_9CYAN|nr:NADH dehydrogenase [uncultured Synechococcales cyanobacterium]
MSDTAITLIIGGGFTGLFTALHLSRLGYDAPVVLIDQSERFIFQPLLYELLSGEMKPELVWLRYEELLQGSGVTFVQAIVQAIDLKQRQVHLTSSKCYSYNQLVIALGSTTGYFNVSGAQEHSWPFRTGEDAVALAHHLRHCLRQARQTPDRAARHTLLTVAVIGAGPTGVELAGTLADLLPAWYVELGGNSAEIRVVLLSRDSKILEGDVNRPIRKAALRGLQQRTVPVEYLLDAEVTAVHANQVEFQRHNQQEFLTAATIVWTAGTTVSPLIKTLPLPELGRDKQGRIQVAPTLQIPGFPEVFAGGDCASVELNPLPATAQVAYQQGAAIARNLKAISQGYSPRPAHITLRGSFLKLGVGDSAANLFDRFAITGKLGNLVRQGTYLDRTPPLGLNLPVITGWLSSEAWNRSQSQQAAPLVRWIGGMVITTLLVGSGLLGWRAVEPQQFNRIWQPTGLPVLLDRLLPSKS